MRGVDGDARPAAGNGATPVRRPAHPGSVGLPRTAPRQRGWHSASGLTRSGGELADGGGVGLAFLDQQGAPPAPAEGEDGTGPPATPAPSGAGVAGGAGAAPDEAGGAGDDDFDFKDKVGRGLRWSFGTQLAMRVASFASGIVLFRVLEPAQFGVYALALAVINVALSVNDLGQDMAVVAWKGEGLRTAQRTASTIAIGMSGVLYAGCFLAAPLIARMADSPSVTGIIRLMALTLLIDGVVTVPRALMYRALDQRHISIGELLTVPVTVTVSVGLVLLGAGPWGPAIGTLSGATAHAIATLRFTPEVPLPGWDRTYAKRLLGFGIPGAGTMTIEMALLNLDSIIVAHQLGPTALGFYALAFNISSWPSTIITNAVRKVSQPAFTKLAARGDWRGPFNRSLIMLLSLLVPVCLLLSVQAKPLVELVYGAKSLPAAPVLSWLVVLGGVRVFAGYLLDLLIALGRPAATFRAEMAWLLATAPALWFGAELGGIRGVAIGHVIVAVTVACPISSPRPTRPVCSSAAWAASSCAPPSARRRAQQRASSPYGSRAPSSPSS
ncbi:MAG: oligosaccharide flippase family protein [Acidimicrobiia bacterium]|nr:oligosaccharide flippase family protein [Acidimicrobiia bacterium]